MALSVQHSAAATQGRRVSAKRPARRPTRRLRAGIDSRDVLLTNLERSDAVDLGGALGEGALDGVNRDELPPVHAPGTIARNLRKRNNEMRDEAGEDDPEAQAAFVEDVERREEHLASLSPPSENEEDADGALIDYLLEAAAEDVTYLTTLVAPRLTETFFRALDGRIGAARLLPSLVLSTDLAATAEGAEEEDDNDELVALETLRSMLQSTVLTSRAVVDALSPPADRLRALLSSPDKKAHINEMAACGEVDSPLLALLEQNVAAAREAGSGDAAKFMDKVLAALRRVHVQDTASKDAERAAERSAILGDSDDGAIDTTSKLIL